MSRGRRHSYRALASTLFIGLLTIGLPLAIGGAWPIAIPFTALLAGVTLAIGGVAGRHQGRIPFGLWVLIGLAAWTLVAWAPLPVLPRTFAPDLHALVERVTDNSRISVLPNATGLTGVRIAALAVIFLLGFRAGWPKACTAVACAGTAVALLGIAQLASGTQQIWWVYQPVDLPVEASWDGIPTSFVNPNHTAALMLLSVPATLASWWNFRTRSNSSNDPKASRRLGDLASAALLAGAIQFGVLLLTRSRLGLGLGILEIVAIGLILASRNKDRRNATAVGSAGLLGAFAIGAALYFQSNAARPLNEVLAQKFRTVQLAIEAHTFSVWLGTGRGTFVDLNRLVDAEPQPFINVHVESFPFTMLLEWGVLATTVAGLALFAWLAKTAKHNRRTGQRLAFAGVVAVLVQNVAGFSGEMLGIAAPLMLLAGSISPAREQGRWKDIVAGGGVASIGLLSFWIVRGGELNTRDLGQRVADNEIDYDEAVAMRPLDARVHIAEARRLLAEQKYERAEVLARFAAEVDPSTIDAPMLACSANLRLGRREAALENLALGLDRLSSVPPTDFTDFLTITFTMSELASVAPTRTRARNTLAAALLRDAPASAEAVATAWLERDSDDLAALRIRTRALVVQDRGSRARADASRLRDLDPTVAEHHTLLAAALRITAGVSPTQVRQVLEDGLTYELDDRGRVLEALIHSYAGSEPIDLERAEAYANELVRVAAPNNAIKRQRLLLRDEIRAKSSSD